MFTVVRSVQRDTLIARQRYGFQEHLGQHNCRSAVDVNAAVQFRDRCREIAEVTETGLANRRTGRCRMHVNDVGAERHVNGYRDVQTMRSNRDAVIGKRRIALRQKCRHRLAQTMAVICAMSDGLVEEHSRLFGHAEASWGQRFIHVFRGGTGYRDFKVMNDTRPVQRNRRHISSPHQVDQHRGDTGLDDMSSETPHNSMTAVARLRDRVNHASDIARAEHRRQ